MAAVGAERPGPTRVPVSGAEFAHRRGRHRQIVDAAFECLAEGEFDRIKIDDVARVAGLAKATLYRYFPSKESLYAVVLHEWTDAQHLRTVSAAGPERARIRAHAMIAAFADSPQFFRLAVALFSSADPVVKAELSGVGAHAYQYFHDDLADLTLITPHEAAIIIQAIVHSAVSASVYHGTDFADAYHLVDQVVRLFVGAPVSPTPGDHVVNTGERVSISAELPTFKQRRRRRIVASAREALRENSYEKIHMSSVARGADVALGTLYRYFPSKEALYAEVIRDWFADSGFTSSMDHLPLESRVTARVRAAFDAFEADPEFFRVNVLLYSIGDERVQAVLADVIASARTILARDLSAAGVPSPGDAATMLWALLGAVTTGAVSYGRTFGEARRTAEVFTGLIVSGADAREEKLEPDS
ncbi:TetR/AcrR family transcriptional regulator [Nocardia miyunensis]|uniref:TetR/AcrR family transcriptional regulator n=1 Tax=Nocardia miyunensis TaxID=282684 RepID=UPI000A0236FC|nr:TetR/AcrR family transcriptional regulator [Nocardia miyunensis]